ncbi:class D sortase [Neobacillus dielmonensis]|uniref:class D sortase n=1 Tax=Neobacillus dielmonensis TaxID=1347369 RepID=UPI0005A818A8|nr:class D sortase [Neobacillus dielmonensis]
MTIGTYYFMEWKTGRSAAEEITNTEIMRINEDDKRLPKELPYLDIQTPSTDIPHKLGEKVAHLVIPKIAQKYSVFWGADKNVLRKGVGIYVSQWTTAPDGGGNTVLSGHRDTVFYRLDELKENEILKLEYDGAIYTYKIAKIWITGPNDQTVIVKKESPTLTITTCYPFNYVGNAPKRYIIQANLLYKQEMNVTYNEMLQKNAIE